MTQVTVAYLTPSLALVHATDVDPPAAATATMSRAQADLLGFIDCPDCW